MEELKGRLKRKENMMGIFAKEMNEHEPQSADHEHFCKYKMIAL